MFLSQMQYHSQSHRIEILIIIGFGYKCWSQTEIADEFNEKYLFTASFARNSFQNLWTVLGHVRLLPRKPNSVDENVKLDTHLNIEETPSAWFVNNSGQS